MKQRIEEVIRDVEQLHAEAIVAGLGVSDSLEHVLDELYWTYKELVEYDA